MFLNDQVIKNYQPTGDHHDFLSRNCCFKVPKIFVGDPSVCHYFQVSKIFLLNRRMSRFSVEIVLSHSVETFRREDFRAVVQRTSGLGSS